MDCSQPGSSVHGIFQASVLEWVPLPSSGLEYCESSILAIIISADSQFPHVEQERVRGGVQIIFLIFIDLFVYFWLHWVFVAVNGLCPVAVSGGYSLSAVRLTSHCSGLSCCGALALGWLGSVVVAQELN